MLTRQGVVATIAGLAAIAIGRAFGVIELFVIGTGFLAAVVVALVFVTLRAPRVSGVRWIHPQVLVAGDVGHVDLQLHHDGTVRSTRFTLLERVSRSNAPDHVAHLAVAPMAARSDAAAAYRLPTSQRGVILLGPVTAEIRDPLGIARRVRPVAGHDRVTVAPRAHRLEIPTLGTGVLGRQLLASARRLGPGEFHALREYADGDEPRSIHWKASARSEQLFVKEYAVEGLRRMLVVFDADPSSYADASSFERGVTAAASVVESANAAGLTTRFVTGDGIDLRGPDVSELALTLLAEIEPMTSSFAQLDRNPGDGIGMMVVVTGTTRSSGWRAASSIIDPTLTPVPITTDEAPRGVTGVAARTDAELVASWHALTGRSDRASTRRSTGAPGPDVASGARSDRTGDAAASGTTSGAELSGAWSR